MNHRNPYAVLVAGTVLHVPGRSQLRPRAGPTYTVQWGDTLSAIAARYHIGLRSLARANDLRPRGLLISGTTLRIPGHAPGCAPMAAAPPRRTHVQQAHRSRLARPLPRPPRRHADRASASASASALHRLARANGLHVRALLITGTRLRVPAHAAHAARPRPPPPRCAGALVGRLVDRPLERPLRRRRRISCGRSPGRSPGWNPSRRLGRRRVGRHAGDARDVVVRRGRGDRGAGRPHARRRRPGRGRVPAPSAGRVRRQRAPVGRRLLPGRDARRACSASCPISKPYVANVLALRTRL